MKMLAIGIDGGDRHILQSMPMPNLHNLLNQNVYIDIEEDLWSRGWAKILCGAPGHESGAYYAKLLLDGTHNTTQKFDVSDFSINPNFQPLWTKLNKAGQHVGFMNVPCMMPAPEVSGFVVSGGGAGSTTSGSSLITPEACYPKNLREFLENIDYVLDLRTVSSQITNIDEFIQKLLDMTCYRTDALLKLQKRFNVQFCFVAYMALNRIQNLAMSEIEMLIQNENKPATSFQEKLLYFYNKFDEQIGRLLSHISPSHVMFVSDHGQSPRLYAINLNEWLVHSKFQFPSKQSFNLIKKTAKTVAKLMPHSLNKIISSSAPGIKAKVSGRNLDWESTIAFGVRYIPGIYINDKKRFNGPVKTQTEMNELIREIIIRFNDSEQASEHGLVASEYRNKYKHSKCETLLPDIWIDHADTYFFEQDGRFIEPNKEYAPIKDLSDVNRDMFTGIKGRYPILSVDKQLADLVQGNDQRDLTLAYKIIVRGMSS